MWAGLVNASKRERLERGGKPKAWERGRRRGRCSQKKHSTKQETLKEITRIVPQQACLDEGKRPPFRGKGVRS
jgi:hypothetical protein